MRSGSQSIISISNNISNEEINKAESARMNINKYEFQINQRSEE